MRIDAHQHFWNFDPVRDSWIDATMQVLQRDFLPEDIRPLLEENNIQGCVAIQADQSLAETSFLLSLAEENDFIKGVVGWVDLAARDVSDQLSRLRENKKLKGFRHIVQAEPSGFLVKDSFIQGVRELGNQGFTYDLLIYPHQLGDALKFMGRVGEVKVVVDHMAKPSVRTGEKTHWELDMAALATFKNVYCKISGLVTEAVWNSWTKEQIFPFLDEVMESFGPSRLMYGSDWPVCLLAASYREQLQIVSDYISQLSRSEQERIMGGAAIEFYSL